MLDARTGFTPLHEVANRGGLRSGGVIGILVDAQANVLEVDMRGASALHLAAMRGEFHAAVALVSAAARIRYQTNLLVMLDQDGKTAVDLAEAGGHMQIARYLVSLGGPRGPRDLGYHECAWALADSVLLGNVGAILTEIDKPMVNRSLGSTHAACFHPPSREKRPLLHVALAIAVLQARPGGLDVVETLLKSGANATEPDGRGDLPLSKAVRADRTDLVVALLTAMPTGGVDAQDAQGRTALIEASRVGARGAASRLMMGGASVDMRDRSGFTALDYARNEGHEDVASAIDMAVRLPPAQLSIPGMMMNSQDFPPEEIAGADQNSSNVALIIGVTIGAVVGLVAAVSMVIAARVVRKRCNSDRWNIETYKEPTPDETRESLRKAIQKEASKKEKEEKQEKRESKKKAKLLDLSSESRASGLVPPGQIGSDSSEADGCTPKGSRSRRLPTVTLRAAGQQPKAKGQRSLSPESQALRALSDSEFPSPAGRGITPRQKPIKDRDSLSLPPSPGANAISRSRIMSAAAAKASMSEPTSPLHVAKAAAGPMPPPLPDRLAGENKQASPKSAQDAILLAKQVAAASRDRWAKPGSGASISFNSELPGSARLGRSLSSSSSDGSALGGFAAKAKAAPKGKGIASARSNGVPSYSGSSTPTTASAASTAGAALRAAGISQDRSSLPFNDARLPASLRSSTGMNSSHRPTENSQFADDVFRSTAKARSKPKAHASSPARQSVL
jgi:ankyrin repeat protein